MQRYDFFPNCQTFSKLFCTKKRKFSRFLTNINSKRAITLYILFKYCKYPLSPSIFVFLLLSTRQTELAKAEFVLTNYEISRQTTLWDLRRSHQVQLRTCMAQIWTILLSAWLTTAYEFPASSGHFQAMGVQRFWVQNVVSIVQKHPISTQKTNVWRTETASLCRASDRFGWSKAPVRMKLTPASDEASGRSAPSEPVRSLYTNLFELLPKC